MTSGYGGSGPVRDPRYGNPRYGPDPYGADGPEPGRRPGIDAARLWAGGVATAVVAALTAIVGLLIARGVFHVTVLEPKGGGLWGSASGVTYALIAAVVALLATGLMQLLYLAVPAPGAFFSWIMVLLTLIAVVVPLTLSVPVSQKAATAAINLVIGLVITIVVHGMAARARTVHQRRRTAVPDAPTQRFPGPSGPPPGSRDYGG